MESDYHFGDFLRLPAFRSNGRTNLSLRVGPNRDRLLSLVILEELMQASVFERHVASGFPRITNLLRP